MYGSFFFPIPHYLLPSFRLPPSLLFAEDSVSSGVTLGIYEPVEAALPPGAAGPQSHIKQGAPPPKMKGGHVKWAAGVYFF